jgi:Lysylphosphatidylglycerol synthase TM region
VTWCEWGCSPGSSRTAPAHWTAAGGLAAIAVVRAACLAVLGSVAWALGGLPLWPLLALGGVVSSVLVAVFLLRKRAPQRHLGHLFDAFRALASSPIEAGRLVGWVALGLAARVCAGTAIGMALGVPAPVITALLIVAALDLAGQFPLTPGNIGVANDAVVLALGSRGITLTTALAIGFAFQAIQTTVDVGGGVAGLLHGDPDDGRRRRRRRRPPAPRSVGLSTRGPSSRSGDRLRHGPRPLRRLRPDGDPQRHIAPPLRRRLLLAAI